MANRKISELGALTAPAADDLLAVVDVSEGSNANKNKKITYGELFKSVIDGTETAPAIAFDTAGTTGFYKSAANELSIATNGGRAIQIEANNKTTIYGDLVVTGGTTTVSSSTITVADKNIELATGNTSDAGATGGGLTIKAATDKTWNWIDSTDSWTSNQHIDLVSGMSYKIQGNQVLTATALGSAVVGSSLTSVGTLTGLTVSGAINANGGVVGNLTGTASIATTVTVADESTDPSCNVLFATGPTGNLAPKSGTNLTFNSSTGALTATSFVGSFTGNISGNAATATALQTARTIGGVSFDGTANIDLPGVNAVGNQNTSGSSASCTGNAATATALATARTIGGVSFDGTANINLPGVNAVGNQSTSGNAATATALQTARTIGGVSFNGTANINLPGVNQTGNQNTTGSAATLTTARTIGGVSFDGSANINLPGVNAAGNQNTSGTAAGLSGTPNITVGVVTAGTLDISGGADIDGTMEADAYTVNSVPLNEYIADTVGGMVDGGVETNITVTYDDPNNKLNFVIGTLNQDTTGNAATATALETARTIGGVSFDGTANINLPGVNAVGNQNTTGSAATLTTARTIGGVSFNGSANIDLPGVNAVGNQNTTGSAATLTTARTIGGVSFNGSANIDLPGVNTAGNQSTSGNAATATALATARTIGGTSFDGTANITPANATNAVNLTGTIASGVTGTTQSTSDNSTKIATTAYVTTAVANLIDSAPGALNTLNELAAALGDDANFSTTITNSLATKLPLAGGTMTGAINLGSNNITNGGTITGTFVGNITGNVTGNTSGSSGSCTGNAATATALATARTIGGVSFDGTSNINLPGVNAVGNQNTTGSAATLTTARTIGGVSFNGSANIDLPGVNAAGNQNTSGNAATATALATARTIGGVSFDGTANINLPGVNATGNQSTSGNAATATKLATARAINGVNFDGTAAITVTAAAGTLTGNTLASGVTASSLTSVGTLTGLTVSGNISMTGTGAIDVPTGTTAQRPNSPTTGHFRYNSTEGEFEGYTASGWGAIAGGGGGASNFQYLALRNANNNGAASYPGADFTLVTSGTTNAISPAAANVLLVSVGGVIQQPNAGTSTPSTGFAISGSTIKFGSNISAAPDFIIYQLGAGIGSPSDNTVDLAHLVHKAQGDILFYGASGVPSLLNAGTSGKFLRTNGSSANPTWETIDLTNLSASHLTSGTIPDARFPSTLPAASGANLTALNGSNISSGTIAAARVATLNQSTTGNAATATALATARTIGGTSFDGTANITPANATNAVNVTGTVASAVTGTTQSAGNNSTKIATTAYVETAVSNLVDSAPGTLNTLNELAAALGDDANFSTTVTNSIATKLPLAGGTLTGNVRYNDNILAEFGSSGDMYMKFDGSSGIGYIQMGTGGGFHSQQFYINSDHFHLYEQDGTTPMIHADDTTGLQIYHQGVKAFSTTTNGVEVYGAEANDASLYLFPDEADDMADQWRIRAAHTSQNLRIESRNSSGNYEQNISCVGDGAVEIYHNAVKKFATTSYGAELTGNFLSDGNNSRDLGSTSNRWANIYSVGGSLTGELSIDTSATASTVCQTLKAPQNDRLNVWKNNDNGGGSWYATGGASNSIHLQWNSYSTGNILYMMNDGKIGFNTTSIETNSKYEFVDCVGIRNNGGGYLQRFLNSSSTAGLTGYIADDNQSALQFIAYDSSYKISFGTNNTSRLTIEAGGDVLPGADNSQDLGSTSKRWANIYCGDMNLSNKDSKNCVDSTWGEWVIQEGEEDLYLINKRKNKAYKFQLELVKDLNGSSNVKDILDGPPSKDQLPVGDPN